MRYALLLAGLALTASIGCRMLDSSPQPAVAAPVLPGQSTEVFSIAHTSLGSAINDFFGRRPEAEQPFDFPHDIHAGRKIACTEYCHEAALTGPAAGLPGVRTCLGCHNTIAADRPRIREIAAMFAEGRDFAWQRVYGYVPQAHVRFNHAPHLRADVECATCHGDIASGTVAERNVDLTMGFCVNCHQEREASIDCLTCHF